MNAASIGVDPRNATGGGESEPASKRVTVGFGFWIYLFSDIIMFATFFAAYALLSGATASGPMGRDLFDLRNVAIETGLFLASNLACGIASIAAEDRNQPVTLILLAVTELLGSAFLSLGVQEFVGVVGRDPGPSRRPFLSAFFAVVGLHGLHIAVELIWLAIVMAHILPSCFRVDVGRRLLCSTLFWHALDIV